MWVWVWRSSSSSSTPVHSPSPLLFKAPPLLLGSGVDRLAPDSDKDRSLLALAPHSINAPADDDDDGLAGCLGSLGWFRGSVFCCCCFLLWRRRPQTVALPIRCHGRRPDVAAGRRGSWHRRRLRRPARRRGRAVVRRAAHGPPPGPQLRRDRLLRSFHPGCLSVRHCFLVLGPFCILHPFRCWCVVPMCVVAVEWGKGGRSSSAPEHQGARQFSLDELAQATKSFSEANLVGLGSFGLVYKGLLLDGSVVAIKKRIGAPRQEFAEEVKCGCRIRVILLLGGKDWNSFFFYRRMEFSCVLSLNCVGLNCSSCVCMLSGFFRCLLQCLVVLSVTPIRFWN